MSPAESTLADYPLRTYEKLRYADTDRQGHVNNAVFSTLLETGRVELLYQPGAPLHAEGCAFVIASLHLDFQGEITWPGQVDIGTRVSSVGKSSLSLEQVLFQHDRCVATAKTVIVQMDETSRRAHPLNDGARHRLTELMPAAA
ncbi:MAG: acyl-CoA thioesterase [Zoogloea sp.]|nr:acyl-CoA thioesterase [Zoogloea sp.]